MPDIIIRPFDPADQDGARAVIAAGMRERWGPAFDMSLNTDVDDIASYYANSVFLVACERAAQDQSNEVSHLAPHGALHPASYFVRRDRIVATGAMTPQPDGAAIVTRMSTLASHRRHGIARSLLDHLIARARHANCERVVLSTNIGWDDAIAFYAACGFKELRRTDAGVVFVLPLT
jgi:GNAT superfamily N-acetyltransferase